MSLPEIISPAAATDLIFDRARHSQSKFTALGACVFAGAFSFGAEDAGFKVVGHLEADDLTLGARVSTQKWPVLVQPTSKWPDFAASMKEAGTVPNVIYMNPPCSAYAKNGLRKGLEDPVMCYLRACHQLGLDAEPDAFVWELVPGIFERDLEYLRSLAATANERGYETHAFLTNSAIHGAPQSRPRFHFVASKYNIDWDGVYETEPLFRKGWKPIQVALDAVGAAIKSGKKLKNHMDSLGNTQLERLVKYCPPGTYISQLPDEIYIANYKKRGGIPWQPGDNQPGISRLRAMSTKPCPVVVGGMVVAHPTEDRFLSARECATVMGFPLDYEFSSGKSYPFKEIGKGLCRENAAFVMRAIHRALEDKVPARPNEGLITTDWRGKAQVPTLTCSEEERRKYAEERGFEWGGKSKSVMPKSRVGGGQNLTRAIQIVGSPPDGLLDQLDSVGIRVGTSGPKIGFAQGYAELMPVLLGLTDGDYVYTDVTIPPNMPVNVIDEDDVFSAILAITGVGVLPLVKAKLGALTNEQLTRVMGFIDALISEETIEESEDDDMEE